MENITKTISVAESFDGESISDFALVVHCTKEELDSIKTKVLEYKNKKINKQNALNLIKDSELEKRLKDLEEGLVYSKRLSSKAYLETEIDNGSIEEPIGYKEFCDMFSQYVKGNEWDEKKAPFIFQEIFERK